MRACTSSSPGSTECSAPLDSPESAIPSWNLPLELCGVNSFRLRGARRAFSFGEV